MAMMFPVLGLFMPAMPVVRVVHLPWIWIGNHHRGRMYYHGSPMYHHGCRLHIHWRWLHVHWRWLHIYWRRFHVHWRRCHHDRQREAKSDRHMHTAGLSRPW